MQKDGEGAKRKNNDAESPKANRQVKDPLSGTTLKVYRILYREGKPLGVYEVQRRVGLSSPSVAHYHLQKLRELSLVREEDGGYVVDKLIFENLIRIRRSLIPLQATFLAFFTTTLLGLVFVFRPSTISNLYIFSLLINCSAIGVFGYQTLSTLRNTST